VGKKCKIFEHSNVTLILILIDTVILIAVETFHILPNVLKIDKARRIIRHLCSIQSPWMIPWMPRSVYVNEKFEIEFARVAEAERGYAPTWLDSAWRRRHGWRSAESRRVSLRSRETRRAIVAPLSLHWHGHIWWSLFLSCVFSTAHSVYRRVTRRNERDERNRRHYEAVGRQRIGGAAGRRKKAMTAAARR